jgi:O-antigen ligase
VTSLVTQRPLVSVATVLGPLLVGAAAVVSPRGTLLLAVAAVTTWLMIKRLLLGLAIFVFLIFFEQAPFLNQQPIARPLGAILVLSWIVAILRREHVPQLSTSHPFIAGSAVGFTAWAVISLVWARDLAAATYQAQRLILVTILLFVTFSVIRTAADLRVVIWAFTSGAFVSSLLGMVEGTVSGDRLVGGILDPNFLAALTVGAFVLAAFQLTYEPSLAARAVLVVYLCVFAVTFVETQSRGGIIGFAAAVTFAVVFGGPLRRLAVVACLVVVAGGVAYYAALAPPDVRERATSFSAASSAGRSDSWQIAARMGLDNPVLGVGINNFGIVEPRYADETFNIRKVDFVVNARLVTHNTYLEPFAELGLAGLTLFLGVIVGALVIAVRSVQALSGRDLRSEIIARSIVIAMGSMLVSYTFVSAQYDKHLWLGLGLLASLSTVASAALGSREPSDA